MYAKRQADKIFIFIYTYTWVLSKEKDVRDNTDRFRCKFWGQKSESCIRRSMNKMRRNTKRECFNFCFLLLFFLFFMERLETAGPKVRKAMMPKPDSIFILSCLWWIRYKLWDHYKFMQLYFGVIKDFKWYIPNFMNAKYLVARENVVMPNFIKDFYWYVSLAIDWREEKDGTWKLINESGGIFQFKEKF